MQRNTWSDTQRTWLQTGIPFTIALIALKIVSLFFTTVPSLAAVLGQLTFIAPSSILKPWTLLTYSIVAGGDFIAFLFDIGLTYWFCSSLERSWGTKTFMIFFAAVTAVTAVSLTVGALLLHTPLGANHMLPVAACALAWGIANAEERVSLFFIPMRGIHMALVAIGFVMFQFAGSRPLIAPAPNSALNRVAYETAGWWAVPFALAGCGLAWLWMHHGWQYGFGTLLPNIPRKVSTRPSLRMVPPKSTKPKDDRFTLRDLNPLEWIAKRRRRKQFEKLMNDD